MSATISMHQPQPIIPTDSYSETIRQTLAGRPTAQPDAEPPRRSRKWWGRAGEWFTWNKVTGMIALLAVAVAVLYAVSWFTPKPAAALPDPKAMAGLADRAAPIVTVTSVSTVTPTATPQTVASVPSTPIVATVKPPAFITQDCIYQMQVVVEGEIGGVHDQQAADFVAAQVLYTALASQCRQGMDQRGSIQNVWFGWRKYAGTGTAIVLTAQTSNAVNRALVNLSKPLFPKCLYTGSAADVFGVWLKSDKSLSVDVALPSYPQAPQVFGLDCPQGK